LSNPDIRCMFPNDFNNCPGIVLYCLALLTVPSLSSLSFIVSEHPRMFQEEEAGGGTGCLTLCRSQVHFHVQKTVQPYVKHLHTE
jgi:hypothetical protein